MLFLTVELIMKTSAIDGIRALLILGVVAGHVFQPVWLTEGNTRVVGFFTLTGFLITSVLLKEYHKTQNVELLRFWTKRAKRLLPPLIPLAFFLIFLTFVVSLNLTPAIGPDWTTLGNTLKSLFTHTVAWDAATDVPVGFEVLPQWSTNVEWLYYLIVAGLLVVGIRKGVSSLKLAGIVTIVAVASFSWSAVLTQVIPDGNRLMYGPDTRSGTLFIGTAGALLLTSSFVQDKIKLYSTYIIPFTLMILFVMYTTFVVDVSSHMTTWGQPLLGVVLTLLLATLWLETSSDSAVIKFLLKCLTFVAVVWVAQRAYGLFLYHIPCLHLCGGSETTLGLKIVSVGLAFVLAHLSWELLEKHCNKPKRSTELSFNFDSVSLQKVNS